MVSKVTKVFAICVYQLVTRVTVITIAVKWLLNKPEGCSKDEPQKT